MTKSFYQDIVKITPFDLIGPLNDVEEKFAPKELFFKGNKNIIDEGPRVSIIGTRNPTETGIKNAVILTKFFVENGVIIVSGLAKGIDTVAHKTAIKEGGKTIAVLGTPLDKYYPLENKELQDELMKNHLVISQFAVGSAILPTNFPARNRTMALISHVSIIVEANEKSGTIHQGWEALRLGRHLFILEDIVNDKKLKWPNELIKYGAEILPMNKKNLVLEVLPCSTALEQVGEINANQ